MNPEAAQRVILFIDSPDEPRETKFHKVRDAEVPKERDSRFVEPLDRLLTAHIVVRSPDDGARILADIRQQWADGNDAWSKQYLPTNDEVRMLIVGLTVVSEAPGEWVFRIYTPREEFVSE